MLSYYLQWHLNQRLSKVYENDGNGKNRRWSFQQIIERLKGVRIQNVTIGKVNVTNMISTPDEEQKLLLEALRSKL